MSSENIFEEPLDSSRSQSLVPSAETPDEENYPELIEIDSVKITPGHMCFENAYEGKQFEKKMVIQNCGGRIAFVRLLEPSSKTFRLKTFFRGHYLCPGMKIIRIVKFTYNRALGIKQGFATFYINSKEVTYHFDVTMAVPVLSIDPPLIDFGRIDAVNHAAIRYFFLKNSGYKGAQFSIDLGRNPLEMMIEPMKGSIPAKSSVQISIEIVSSHEGEFTEEFWIKTSPPQRVVVTGVFISPKLLVRKFISSLDFTLLDFKPTYYGTTTSQSLLLKNFSSSHSMFCVMAEIKGATMTLDQARKIDDNYKNFIVKPIDGRMAALKGALVQITFAPTQTRKRDKKYAACFLKVIRLDCRDISSSDEVICASLKQSTSYDIGNRSEAASIVFSESRATFSIPENALEKFALVTEEDKPTDGFSFEHTIGVCLHGTKEEAGITLRPSVITLNELTLDKKYQREVLITNKSRELPVVVKYNTVPTIDVIPLQFDLEPGGSQEVLVKIRTYKLDRIVKYINFKLLSRVVSKDTTTILRRVGTATFKIQTETTKVEKKPKITKCVQCEELPQQLKPEFPYRMTKNESLKRDQNNEHYLNYIRSLQKPPPPENEELADYPVTYSKLLLRQNVKCQDPDPRAKKIWRFTPFIPLAPRLLFNIKLTPKSIRLRKVAAFTTINDFFEIENLNAFPIRLMVNATKPCISFAIQSRYVIEKEEKKKIQFSFSTNRVGRYFVNINILVNDATLYEVTAVAHVVPKTLKVESSTVEFGEEDGDFKFFRIVNPLNTYTSFDWDVPGNFYEIHPLQGGIKAERDMLCLITHTPDPYQPNITECVLTSESSQQRTVTISAKKVEHLVVFDTYEVNVGVIPLNVLIRKNIILRNLKNSQALFNISNAVPIPGVTIEPNHGRLEGLNCQVFVINILLKAIIEFSTKIIFRIQDNEEICVILKGTVEYPKISLNPDQLYFRKISPYSYDTLAFKVRNLSQCEASVAFLVEEFPEFTITDSELEEFPQVTKILLKPDEARVLFLHFHPDYISTHSLYLPYIINGILGPVRISSAPSTTSAYYLRKDMTPYDKNADVRILTFPRNLPMVRLNCSAINKILDFSSLKMSFVYYGQGHYNNVTTLDLEITNTSNEEAAICVRIDDLQYPFTFNPKGETNTEYYDVSYKVVLQPGEKISFEGEFFPEEMGHYIIKLPVFLRHYFDNKIFNFLTLEGVYDTPSIIPSKNSFDFESVPVHIPSEIDFTLNMKNHFENCEVLFDCDLPGLYPNFPNGNSPATGDSVLDVTLSYLGHTTTFFDRTLVFNCSCNGTCTVTVTGVTENNLLTTHAFSHFLYSQKTSEAPNVSEKSLVSFGNVSGTSAKSLHTPLRPRNVSNPVNRNKTCYPLFPAGDDTSDYGKYMRGLKKTLENWIFTQIFYKKTFYKIPDGLSNFCKVGEPRKKLRFGGLSKATFIEIPFVQMIINIAGPEIRDKLELGAFPTSDDTDLWLTYVSRANSNILRYLRGFQVCMPHVKSKYLLNYGQYCQYEKIKRPNQEPMEEEIFYRIGTQCWVDLILQIIKTFFLIRSVNLASESEIISVPSPTKIKQHRMSITAMSKTSILEEGDSVLDIGIYGQHEKELMAWLINIYNEEKLTLWQHQDFPEDKEMFFIDEDLRDGLILGAVTAHYCPYVKSDIQNMYTRPYNPEEIHHNSCILVKTWQKLQLSYTISPLDIGDKAGMVEMLLLTNYLYQVLPNYLPTEEIKIEAPLTQMNSAAVHLKNLGRDPIFYKVIFFGNERNLFTLGRNCNKLVNVEPLSTKIVKVRYQAKSVRNVTSYILFSGETPGNKYGRSVAISFVGIADVSYACMQIPLNVDLYRPCQVTIQTKSPFKVKANYAMYFGYKPATKDKERNVLYPWEEIKHLKTIKELDLPNEMCEFDENGNSTTKILVCCQQEGPRSMWLYYTNPEVGDWGIQLTLTGQVTDICYENIEVILPQNYQNFTCRCTKKVDVNFNCPLIVYAKIPMKNNPLWNARKAMVMQYVEGEEGKFWQYRIYTPTGTRILKLILDSETHPLKQILQESCEFTIEMDEPAPLVTLNKIFIDDLISEDFIDLPLHPAKNVKLLKVEKCVLRLRDENGSEPTRYYDLFFKDAEEIKQSMAETV